MVKKTKYNSNKAIKNSAKLSLPERKYCSCIMKVRGESFKKSKKSNKNTKRMTKSNVINPYGICNKSVLRNKKYASLKKKRIMCSVHYKFNKYPTEYLQAYLLEKNESILNKKGVPLSRSALLKTINNKIKSEKNKYSNILND